jgi:predicted transcriptional regulator
MSAVTTPTHTHPPTEVFSPKINRSRTEIIAAMLEAVKRAKHVGVGRTSIMYQACIATNQAKEYIPLLMNADLVSYYEDLYKHKRFYITENGLRFLEVYENLKRGLQEEEELTQ